MRTKPDPGTRRFHSITVVSKPGHNTGRFVHFAQRRKRLPFVSRCSCH